MNATPLVPVTVLTFDAVLPVQQYLADTAGGLDITREFLFVLRMTWADTLRRGRPATRSTQRKA